MMNRRRRHIMLFIAGLSVVGVLSIHGLDPAVATLDQTHSGHGPDTATGGGDHAAIGLCVFLVAVATLGLAATKRLQNAKTPINLIDWRVRFTRHETVRTSGPPLLYRLCGLRL